MADNLLSSSSTAGRLLADHRYMKLFGSVLFILSQFKSGLPRHCFDVRAEFDPYPQGNGTHSARIKMYLNIGYEFHNSVR